MHNLLLLTDVYKLSHAAQYPPRTNKIYSYLEARGQGRGGEHLDSTVFFGLQYYIKEYLSQPITRDDVAYVEEIASEILGKTQTFPHMRSLAKMGYLPIRIRAVPEGSNIPLGNVLMTITNTRDDCFWLVNYLETLLMKLWAPITVASNSRYLRNMFDDFAKDTCDDNSHVPFQMHDFGYRGCASEESAGITGAAHLLSFYGTDTIAAHSLLKNYYNAKKPIGLSVPASEHSVMCSWSHDNDDHQAIRNMLTTYPEGIVSIVSDSYDLFKTIKEYYAGSLKDLVLSRNGKTVIRPDSGVPEHIVCGDPNGKTEEEKLGVIRLLDKYFGSTVNSKGYRVLNPKVGCIYGDGITRERAELILDTLKQMKYASSNIVFGSGGLLLNNWSRDTLKMAIKATYCEVDYCPRPIEKSPKTDSGKRSKKGLLMLDKIDGKIVTLQNQSIDDERLGYLVTHFDNGAIIHDYSLEEIRNNYEKCS